MISARTAAVVIATAYVLCAAVFIYCIWTRGTAPDDPYYP